MTIIVIVELLLLFLLLLLTVCSAEASGFGVSPDKIEWLVNRNSISSRTITIFNTESKRLAFKLDSDNHNYIFIPVAGDIEPGGNAQVRIMLNVSELVANGEYKDTIKIQILDKKNVEESDSQKIIVGTLLRSTIIVTGEQKLAGIVNNIILQDFEEAGVGEVRVTYSNTGTVFLQPQMELRIRTVDEQHKELQVLNEKLKKIGPGESTDDTTVWRNNNLAEGRYLAEIKLFFGADDIAAEETIPFAILPFGFFFRNGTLEAVGINYSLPQMPAKISAVFENSGNVSLIAKARSEIYLDGSLLGIVDSDEKIVQKGEKVTLDLLTVLPSPGEYRVVTRVYYSGRESSSVETVFSLRNSPQKSLLTGLVTLKSSINLSPDDRYFSRKITVLCLGVILIGVFFYVRGNNKFLRK